MNRWEELREWIKQEALRADSFTISTILILAKMREIEEMDRREMLSFYQQEPFDGET